MIFSISPYRLVIYYNIFSRAKKGHIFADKGEIEVMLTEPQAIPPLSDEHSRNACWHPNTNLRWYALGMQNRVANWLCVRPASSQISFTLIYATFQIFSKSTAVGISTSAEISSGSPQATDNSHLDIKATFSHWWRPSKPDKNLCHTSYPLTLPSLLFTCHRCTAESVAIL